MMVTRALVATASIGLGVVSALAADPMGSAGSFRSVGWAQCQAPHAEWQRGACDPAPVDGSLSGSPLAHAHVERARALVAQTRMEEALKAADAAVAADPDNVAGRTLRGRLLATLGRSDAAERDYNAGLMLAPGDPVLRASRAELLLGRGDTRAALADIQAATAQRPDDVDVLWIKARIHMRLPRFDVAERDLDRAVAIEPEERRTRLLRAQLRLRLGNYVGAADDASHVLSGRPSDPTARETRAIARIGLDRPAEAIDDLNAILGPPGEASPAVASPHYREFLFQRALLLAQLGRAKDADADIGTLLRAGGKQAVLRVQLYLRQHGFPDVRVDGERSSGFDDAFRACIVDQACGRGLTRHI
jgi:tetratricopeptide (TPR) repeat protein